MDTSINQLSVESSLEVLRRLICSPGHVVTESGLRATGVDVDLLESMYGANVKPYLDYLHGYERLELLDPLKGRRSGYERREDYDPFKGRPWGMSANGQDGELLWHGLLARCGMLGQRTKARLIFKESFHNTDSQWDGPSEVTVAFYLTRSAKWLFWYAEGGIRHSARFPNEQLTAHDTVRAAWEMAHSLVPDCYKVNLNYAPVNHLPLLIEHGLQRILRETIEERESRLDILKSALDSAERRSGIIHK